MRVSSRSFGSKRDKKPLKKRGVLLLARKKFCRFCSSKAKTIDYKDVKRLEAFVTERGKIVSSRFSGNCAKHQRRVVEALKKSRFLSLLPYIR
ncbi:MAG: 30S ribosomal protein S18 [Candidatus Omnitrophota bacterium]